MRVSVVRFCSARVDMLDFSQRMLESNAGTTDFDTVVLTWNATEELLDWLSAHRPRIAYFDYGADPSLGYVPNLRRMFNQGFTHGFMLNDCVSICDADMAFGPNWLVNLMKHAGERQIPNSTHVTRIIGPHVISADLGEPTEQTFNHAEFARICAQHRPTVTDLDTGDWQHCATLPYILHRSLWDAHGPWEVECGKDPMPPDRRFFRRCHEAGVRFVLVGDSICYHHEATERRGKRPRGLEHYPEGR